MNTLDLTKAGGFPFTQDMLDWMQQNSIAVMQALGVKCLPPSLADTPNTPVVITGMEYNSSTQTYSAGWLLYNGELLQLPVATAVPGPLLPLGQSYGFGIVESDTPVSYGDGSTHGSKISRTITIGQNTDLTTATFISFASTKIYRFDNSLKEPDETHVVISGLTGVTGDIYYRKSFMSNTLQIRGVINVIAASIVSPPAEQTIITLTSKYRPLAQDIHWHSNAWYDLSMLEDSTGLDYINNVSLKLQTSGELKVLARKGAADYSTTFNIIIPLD
ncbi:MAG: hypothetical protein ACTHJ0_09730 [Flavipsychrobacter sp.]